MLKTLLSLAAVLGLMLVILLPLRKFFAGARAVKGESVPIDVLGHRMLQPKRSVYVLRVMNSVVVVGVTEAGMQTLLEVKDAVVHPALEGVPAGPGEESVGSRWMTGRAGGGKKFSDILQMSLAGVLRDVGWTRKSPVTVQRESGNAG